MYGQGAVILTFKQQKRVRSDIASVRILVKVIYTKLT